MRTQTLTQKVGNTAGAVVGRIFHPIVDFPDKCLDYLSPLEKVERISLEEIPAIGNVIPNPLLDSRVAEVKLPEIKPVVTKSTEAKSCNCVMPKQIPLFAVSPNFYFGFHPSRGNLENTIAVEVSRDTHDKINKVELTHYSPDKQSMCVVELFGVNPLALATGVKLLAEKHRFKTDSNGRVLYEDTPLLPKEKDEYPVQIDAVIKSTMIFQMLDSLPKEVRDFIDPYNYINKAKISEAH